MTRPGTLRNPAQASAGLRMPPFRVATPVSPIVTRSAICPPHEIGRPPISMSPTTNAFPFARAARGHLVDRAQPLARLPARDLQVVADRLAVRLAPALGLEPHDVERHRVGERDGVALPGEGVDVGADARVAGPQPLAEAGAGDELVGVGEHPVAALAQHRRVRGELDLGPQAVGRVGEVHRPPGRVPDVARVVGAARHELGLGGVGADVPAVEGDEDVRRDAREELPVLRPLAGEVDARDLARVGVAVRVPLQVLVLGAEAVAPAALKALGGAVGPRAVGAEPQQQGPREAGPGDELPRRAGARRHLGRVVELRRPARPPDAGDRAVEAGGLLPAPLAQARGVGHIAHAPRGVQPVERRHGASLRRSAAPRHARRGAPSPPGRRERCHAPRGLEPLTVHA